MHRVHAPMAALPSVTLSVAEAHHVTRVLRLRVGAELTVFDGRGHEWLGRVSSVARLAVIVDLLGERTPVAEPGVRVTIGVGLLKGDHMDAAVRDATMMGAAVVAPFVSAHVALPEQAWRTRSAARWERVAVASAKQCERSVIPELRPVVSFAELMNEHGALKVMCVEPVHGRARPVSDLSRPRQALLLIGPEGGWSAAELELAQVSGTQFITLGPRTLRAEAAPTVALSALWTHWGWE